MSRSRVDAIATGWTVPGEMGVKRRVRETPERKVRRLVGERLALDVALSGRAARACEARTVTPTI